MCGRKIHKYKFSDNPVLYQYDQLLGHVNSFCLIHVTQRNLKHLIKILHMKRRTDVNRFNSRTFVTETKCEGNIVLRHRNHDRFYTD